MLHHYVNVDLILGIAGIVVRVASILIGGISSIITITTTTPAANRFLRKHMDTDCILTLFFVVSKDKSWDIYDLDRVIVTKLTNQGYYMNVIVTNGIHSGKKSHNPHRLKHLLVYLSHQNWLQQTRRGRQEPWG